MNDSDFHSEKLCFDSRQVFSPLRFNKPNSLGKSAALSLTGKSSFKLNKISSFLCELGIMGTLVSIISLNS